MLNRRHFFAANLATILAPDRRPTDHALDPLVQLNPREAES
jgi:hypothetical protein